MKKLVATFLFGTSLFYAKSPEVKYNTSLIEKWKGQKITDVQLKGCTVLNCEKWQTHFQEKFLSAEVSTSFIDNLQKTSKQVNDAYQKLGYVYSYVDSFFLAKSKQGLTLSIIIHENPIEKIKVTGTSRKKDVLEILRLQKGTPYNQIQMEESSQRLFRSDLFQRHFKKVSITPLILKNNKMFLGVHIVEKKQGEVMIASGNTKSDAYAVIQIHDPALYGTKNQGTLKADIAFFSQIKYYSFKANFSDEDVIEETNPLRYRLEGMYEKYPYLSREFIKGNFIISSLLSFSSVPMFVGLGYDFRSNRSNYDNSLFLSFRYDDTPYRIFQYRATVVKAWLGYGFHLANWYYSAFLQTWQNINLDFSYRIAFFSRHLEPGLASTFSPYFDVALFTNEAKFHSASFSLLYTVDSFFLGVQTLSYYELSKWHFGVGPVFFVFYRGMIAKTSFVYESKTKMRFMAWAELTW
ncbi:MAG: hypothetical protein D6767_07710 [Candidatus Hydrogenedentota bacterium]|nr:MAG: hypothetical protein D6767_07710 [Candidatus Hydrogenedentota bacterium]